MRISTLLILIGLTTGLARAAPLPLEVVEYVDHYRVVLYLDKDQLQAIPAWRPGEGDPPMSLGAAVSRTLVWVEKSSLLKGARIHELSFKPVHNFEAQNRWYYLVELRQSGKKHFLAVLPDGDVVPAIRESGR